MTSMKMMMGLKGITIEMIIILLTIGVILSVRTSVVDDADDDDQEA